MKKREIGVVFLVIFVLVLVLATGCSKQNKTQELQLGKYVMQGTEPGSWSWVLLKENNQFVFQRSAVMSYLPYGTYSIEDKLLTLYVNEDESYVFTINGDKLIFESGNIPGDVIKKGAVFKLSDKK